MSHLLMSVCSYGLDKFYTPIQIHGSPTFRICKFCLVPLQEGDKKIEKFKKQQPNMTQKCHLNWHISRVLYSQR